MDFVLPKMDETEAALWVTAIDSLDGFKNTFTVDLRDFFPGESGLDAVAMRLMNPEQAWEISAPLHYELTFQAIEAI